MRRQSPRNAVPGGCNERRDARAVAHPQRNLVVNGCGALGRQRAVRRQLGGVRAQVINGSSQLARRARALSQQRQLVGRRGRQQRAIRTSTRNSGGCSGGTTVPIVVAAIMVAATRAAYRTPCACQQVHRNLTCHRQRHGDVRQRVAALQCKPRLQTALLHLRVVPTPQRRRCCLGIGYRAGRHRGGNGGGGAAVAHHRVNRRHVHLPYHHGGRLGDIHHRHRLTIQAVQPRVTRRLAGMHGPLPHAVRAPLHLPRHRRRGARLWPPIQRRQHACRLGVVMPHQRRQRRQRRCRRRGPIAGVVAPACQCRRRRTGPQHLRLPLCRRHQRRGAWHGRRTTSCSSSSSRYRPSPAPASPRSPIPLRCG